MKYFPTKYDGWWVSYGTPTSWERLYRVGSKRVAVSECAKKNSEQALPKEELATAADFAAAIAVARERRTPTRSRNP